MSAELPAPARFRLWLARLCDLDRDALERSYDVPPREPLSDAETAEVKRLTELGERATRDGYRLAGARGRRQRMAAWQAAMAALGAPPADEAASAEKGGES